MFLPDSPICFKIATIKLGLSADINKRKPNNTNKKLPFPTTFGQYVFLTFKWRGQDKDI